MTYLRKPIIKIIVLILIIVYFRNKMFQKLISAFELPIVEMVLKEFVALMLLILLILIFIMRFILKYDLKKIKEITSKYILVFLNFYLIFSLFVVIYLKLAMPFVLFALILLLITIFLFFSKNKFKTLKIALIILLFFNLLIGYGFIHKYNEEVNIVKNYFYKIIENPKPPKDFSDLYTKNLMEDVDYEEHFYSIKIWFIEKNISKRNIQKSYLYLVDEYEREEKEYIRMYFSFGGDKSLGVKLAIANDENKIERVIIPEYNCYPPDYTGDGRITYEDVMKVKELADLR